MNKCFCATLPHRMDCPSLNNGHCPKCGLEWLDSKEDKLCIECSGGEFFMSNVKSAFEQLSKLEDSQVKSAKQEILEIIIKVAKIAQKSPHLNADLFIAALEKELCSPDEK